MHAVSSSETTPVVPKLCDSRRAVATVILSGGRPAKFDRSSGFRGPDPRDRPAAAMTPAYVVKAVWRGWYFRFAGKVGLNLVAEPFAVGFGYPDFDDSPATRPARSAGVGDEAWVGSHGRH